MKVRIISKQGSKFIVESRSHQIIVDQPKEKGGED